MSEPWRRSRPAWLAVITLALAALLAGGFLAPTAVARGGRADAGPAAGQGSPADLTGLRAGDIKGWAKAQRLGDAQRRAEAAEKRTGENRTAKRARSLLKAAGPRAGAAPRAA